MRRKITKFLICGAAITLSACQAHQTGFAPPPPQFYFSENASSEQNYDLAAVQKLAEIAPASGQAVAAGTAIDQGHRANAKQEPSGCSIKDRFDRKDLIAYQWGDNRIGFDVDGIGYDSMEVEEVKLTYRLRLQPIADRKEKCRRGGSWHGIAGTGYAEIVQHDGDAIMKEWREYRRYIDDYLDYLVD